MQALIYERYTDANLADWTLTRLPIPSPGPNEVLVKVYATSLNYIDVQRAVGMFKGLGEKRAFPSQIGYDVAGRITAIGTQVTGYKVGDAVWSCLSEHETANRGTFNEFAVLPTSIIARKPSNMTFAEAASLPLVAITALNALDRFPKSIEGKVVLVTNGLSGVGIAATQLAKLALGASQVITTVSTCKVPLVDKLLGPGVADKVIDYTKEKPSQALEAHSVDTLINVSGDALSLRPIMKRAGVIATVSGIPASDDMARMLLKPPFFARWGMDALDSLNRWRCSQSKLQYSWVLGEPSQTQMERLTRFAEEGKLKAVVAETIPLADLEAIKRAALRIKAQKGGLPGKTVIVVCADEP